MGLGPLVCKKCMRFMDFHKEPKIREDFDDRRESRTLQVYWDCTCGVTQYDADSTHLFVLDSKDFNKLVNEMHGNEVEIVEE